MNEKIRIELNSGRLLEAQFVQDREDGIVVTNPKDLTTGKIRKIQQTYYHTEIKSITRPTSSHRATTNATAPEFDDANQPSTSNNIVGDRLPNVDRLLGKKSFNDDDIKRIQEFAKKSVYISQFDDKYYNAIADMKQQKIIAVNSESAYGRLDPKRPLIAVATSTSVYLFDMLRLGPMKTELKQIFSMESVLKIVHSSAEINDYLVHIEKKCALNNGIDTMMMHFTLKQTRERMSLRDCFAAYFNLPDDFVLQNFNYQNRPLQKEALIRSALTVLLLVELYWHLYGIIMKPLRTATEQFQDIYRNIEDQADLFTNVNRGTYPGVGNIDINAANDLKEAFESLHTN